MSISERTFMQHPHYNDLPVPIQFAVKRLMNRDLSDYIHPADIKIYTMNEKKFYYVSFTDKPIELTFAANEIKVSTPSMKSHQLDTILMVYRTSKATGHDLSVDEDDTDSHEDTSWDLFSYNEKALKEMLQD